jgi:hypothetical protein
MEYESIGFALAPFFWTAKRDVKADAVTGDAPLASASDADTGPRTTSPSRSPLPLRSRFGSGKRNGDAL